MVDKKRLNLKMANTAFVILCLGIVTFLALAPEETTAPLPHDPQHERFFAIKSKKAAEVSCIDCHSENNEAPLPAGHPPKFRCLFCHKRT